MTDEELDKILANMAGAVRRNDPGLLYGGANLISLALKFGGLTQQRLDDGVHRFSDDLITLELCGRTWAITNKRSNAHDAN